MPRTSDVRPWDRVRFSAEARHGADCFEEDPGWAPAQDTRRGGVGPTEDQAGQGNEPRLAVQAGDRLAAGIVQHAVEALLGARSPAQLARWLAPELYESLLRRTGLAARLQGRPQRTRHVAIRAVNGCTPADGVREVTVVLHDGAKVRAAAVRLEAFRGRWRAVALEIG